MSSTSSSSLSAQQKHGNTCFAYFAFCDWSTSPRGLRKIRNEPERTAANTVFVFLRVLHELPRDSESHGTSRNDPPAVAQQLCLVSFLNFYPSADGRFSRPIAVKVGWSSFWACLINQKCLPKRALGILGIPPCRDACSLPLGMTVELTTDRLSPNIQEASLPLFTQLPTEHQDNGASCDGEWPGEHLVETQTFIPNTRGWGRSRRPNVTSHCQSDWPISHPPSKVQRDTCGMCW